jgi:hypothetical protein
MTKYFVLWRNAALLPVWDGPYDEFEAASNATAMRDKNRVAFVVMTSNWREAYR